MKITINNILPISVNAAYRTWRGRVLISAKGREFKQIICKKLTELNLTKIEGKIEMSIIYYFKDNRCRDIDNYQKVLIDCMKDILFEDDKMIYKLILEKHIGYGSNKIIIDIKSII